MSYKYTLKFKTPLSDKEIFVSGEITDSEVEVLQDFVKYARELHQTEYLQKKNYGNYSIADDVNNLVFETEFPSVDASYFVYKLRPFILQDEYSISKENNS